MFENDFITIAAIVALAAILSYRVPFFTKKVISYLSILQIIYLIIIPGTAYTFAYSYLQAILRRPLNVETVFPDSLLVNIILLSLLFTYGGIAIHAVTKMLSEVLRYDKTKAYEINKYFHLTFSHNLTYAGSMLAILCFTLLELNHIAPQNQSSLFFSVIKGIVLGLSLTLAMYSYTVSKDEYMGRWRDLKAVFLVLWIGGVLIFYGIKKTDPSLREYQMLLPVILSFSVLALVNVVLVIRRLKRGKFGLYFRFGGQQKKLIEVDEDQ